MPYRDRITSTVICMNCLPESNVPLLKEYPNIKGDWEINGDTLICPNCSFERPYIKRFSKIGEDGYTKGQRDKLKYIKDNLLALHHGEAHIGSYEFKKFEVVLTDFGAISLSVVTGMIGDEGTAAILVRINRHLFIGPHGGLTLINPARYFKDNDGNTQKTFKYGYIKGDWALKHPSY